MLYFPILDEMSLSTEIKQHADHAAAASRFGDRNDHLPNHAF